jgi:hypothetical protein
VTTILNKLKAQAANGVSYFSNVLISRLFGGNKTHMSDDTAAKNWALNTVFPLLMQ